MFFLAGGIAAFLLGAFGVLASQALSGTQRIAAEGVAFVPALIFVGWWLFGPGLKVESETTVDLPEASVVDMPAVEAALLDLDTHGAGIPTASDDSTASAGSAANPFRLHPMRDPSRIAMYRSTIRRTEDPIPFNLRPHFRAGNE